MIKRTWTGHRSLVVAISAVAVVAIVSAGVLVAVNSGGAPQASLAPTAIATATASPVQSDSPTLEPSPGPTASPTDSPAALASGLAYSDLDGVPTTSDLAHRLPLAIMVDDNVVARPQSGFATASIVYQALADGGEDRYMMVFQERTAPVIGPVRSARPYYVYWAAESKALFGHYGGDVLALKKVIPANAGNIYNEDALNGGACPYHRVVSRAAPHNAYTSSAALISCAAKRHYPATYQNLPVRPFRDDTPPDQRPAGQTISVPYPTGVIGYAFDPASDSYLRSVRGNPQIDPTDKTRVAARNVVVLFQTLTYDTVTEPGHKRPVVANVGSGRAVVFLEGRAIVGTWKKTSNVALTRLYDSSGAEIPLVRGEIFIQSVPTGTALTYK